MGFAITAALAPPAVAASKAAPAGDAFDALLGRLSERAAPGCSLSAARGDEILLEQAFGFADLEHEVPNSAATILEAGSASKQFTAAAVLLLERDGRLRLTDDVRTYIPELPSYGDTITVDHLLTHTSGLRDWRSLFGVAGWVLGERVHANSDALDVIVRQRALNHRPGAEYAYTNSGYTLAAIIVERVSGRSLAEFTRERIFGPLGMSSTRWRDDFRRVVPRRAIAYRRQDEGFAQDMPFENAYGAGGLLTTVGDLAIWNAALDSGRLGAGLSARLQDQPLLADGSRSPYGRGLFIESYRGTREVSHGGVTGGYVAFVARYPQHRLSVSVLCNAAGLADPREAAHRLVDRYLPAGSPPEAPGSGPLTNSAPDRSGAPSVPGEARWRPSPEILSSLTGRYSSEEIGATYVASVEKGRLVLRLERHPRRMWILAPTYQGRFAFAGGNVRFRQVGGGRSKMQISVPRIRELEFLPAGPSADPPESK